MALEEDAELKARDAARRAAFEAARKRAEADVPVEHMHLGHEQADRAHGDSFDHFGAGMIFKGEEGQETPAPKDRTTLDQRMHDSYDHFGSGMFLASDGLPGYGSHSGSRPTTPTNQARGSIIQKMINKRSTQAPFPKLPDFQDARSPASPNFLCAQLVGRTESRSTPHGLAARKAYRLAMPAAGSPSGYTYSRQTQRPKALPERRQDLRRVGSTPQLATAPSMSALTSMRSMSALSSMGALTSSGSVGRLSTLHALPGPELHGRGVTPKWWG
jgi:hypothetical protein